MFYRFKLPNLQAIKEQQTMETSDSYELLFYMLVNIVSERFLNADWYKLFVL